MRKPPMSAENYQLPNMDQIKGCGPNPDSAFFPAGFIICIIASFIKKNLTNFN